MDKKIFKIGYIVGIILVIGIGLFSFYVVKPLLIKPIELTQLKLERNNGEKFNLKLGKPIVINFWAT